VAGYYYKGGMTQAEIADQLGISRKWVNNILKECLEMGIVEINIHGEIAELVEMEAALQKKYNLLAVRVVESSPGDENYKATGQAGAKLLAEFVKDGDIIGFSRGRVLSELVEYLPPIDKKNLIAAQLMGSWNDRFDKLNADSIVRRFCEKTNASANMLYAPVLVADEDLRESMMSEEYFIKSYEVSKSSTIAVMGISSIDIKKYPKVEQRVWEIPKAAAGEVCTHFFDKDGKSVTTELDNFVIALSLEDMYRIPIRIGVAGRPRRFEQVLGAILGKYVNAIVIDSNVAYELLSA
jgi:DNA-binding transcriptional regulator LsrR (DeoR family)